MKATPLLRADPDEYPELSKIINTVVRDVVRIMQVHDIRSVRRFRKDGVFDRPYKKDTVTQLGVPGVPRTVSAIRDSVGSALLDYLEAIGVSGIALEATPEEVSGMGELWNPPAPPVPLATLPASEPAAESAAAPAKTAESPRKGTPAKRQKRTRMPPADGQGCTDKQPQQQGHNR